MDGGFDGLISQFRYHPSALSAEDINKYFAVAHALDPNALGAVLAVQDYLPSCSIGNNTQSPNSMASLPTQ
jgi:hypothetical protein